LNLSLAYIEKGDLPRAVVYFERRCSIDREFGTIFGFMRAILTTRKLSGMDRDELKDVIERLDLSGQDHEKMAVFIHVVAELGKKGFEGAADALLVKLDEAGFAEIADFARGLGHYLEGRFTEALPFVASVMRSEWSPKIYNDHIGEKIPLSEDARNLYLVILGKLDAKRAVAEGEEMLNGNSSPVLVNTVGHLNEADGNNVRAAELYRRAADMNPMFILPLLNRLSLCRASGDMDGYKRLAGEILDRVKRAVAEGKIEQFEYSDIYLILFDEREEAALPMLDDVLALLKKEFPDNYEAVLRKREKGK
jgi:hypothetical protein